MLLQKDFYDGVMLNKKELQELAKMFKSGKYYQYEILEEYGLTAYRFKIYMGIAYDLGYIDDAHYKIKGIKGKYRLAHA